MEQQNQSPNTPSQEGENAIENSLGSPEKTQQMRSMAPPPFQLMAEADGLPAKDEEAAEGSEDLDRQSD